MDGTKKTHALMWKNSGDRDSLLCLMAFVSYTVLSHKFPMRVEMFELNTKDNSCVDHSNRVINIDANANTTTTGVVIEAVTAALREAGNPSSTHHGGAIARGIVTDACDAVSSLVNGSSDETVTFTSGCTEANNTVLHAAVTMGATLVTTEVEHPSVLATARALSSQGVSVSVIGVDADGVIRLDDLETTLACVDRPVVLSIQSANSETGVMQPIAAIADLLEGRTGILFHSDAAQAFGKISVGVGRGAPDVVSISGHKLHAPMGIGAIITKMGEDRIGPLVHGGDQQRGRRAGTEPVALIAGLSAACSARASTFLVDVNRMRKLRDRLEQQLVERVPNARVNGAKAERLPNTSSVTFTGIDGMAMVAQLDAEGIMVSQGSACSSMRPTPSHVLLAMGMTEAEAFSTIRFAVSPLNTIEEIDTVVATIARLTRTMSMFE
ncbi:cysteine desulfurase family protein [Sphingobium sp. C100]|uniref:cysteine desulfurase family protein n=1 Tax=Sphingobium sp. C100 TaxID=1207055 RepID=UPI0004122883|nr:cysteine desulfurase family protein [Sphingobium sp. C100]